MKAAGYISCLVYFYGLYEVTARLVLPNTLYVKVHNVYRYVYMPVSYRMICAFQFPISSIYMYRSIGFVVVQLVSVFVCLFACLFVGSHVYTFTTIL